jgi:hypothetical protein
LDICQALPQQTVSQVLGLPVTKMSSGSAGGTLLGECDYVVAPAPSPSTTTALANLPTVTRVYVSGRSNDEYATLVKEYAAGAGTLQLTDKTIPEVFSPTAGLLVKVPGSDYFLQIAVENSAHDFLQDPAEKLARYFIAGE